MGGALGAHFNSALLKSRMLLNDFFKNSHPPFLRSTMYNDFSEKRHEKRTILK